MVSQILQSTTDGKLPFVLDCIGSKEGSLKPLAKIVKSGAKVAVLLPVIVRDSSVSQTPIYEMDPGASVEWEEGVDVRGVRTHFYLEVCSCCMEFEMWREADLLAG